MKTINPKIQKAQRAPITRGMKKTTVRHIIKLFKINDKEKIPKTSRKKGHITNRTYVRITADFSLQTKPS